MTASASASRSLARAGSNGTTPRFPFATGVDTLRPSMRALAALCQRKPLESHDLDTTPRVHHAARRGGGGVAARGACAAGRADAAHRADGQSAAAAHRELFE